MTVGTYIKTKKHQSQTVVIQRNYLTFEYSLTVLGKELNHLHYHVKSGKKVE